MTDILGSPFLNQGIGPEIIWVVMLEFLILLLLSVWQKGLISSLGSSRVTQPEEEERETLYEYDIPQYPE